MRSKENVKGEVAGDVDNSFDRIRIFQNFCGIFFKWDPCFAWVNRLSSNLAGWFRLVRVDKQYIKALRDPLGDSGDLLTFASSFPINSSVIVSL